MDRGLVQWLLGRGGPKLEVVAFAVTAVAIVALDLHVHREAARTTRGALVQRTRAVPLIALLLGRFEAEQVEYLLDGDLVTKAVEVDSRHGLLVLIERGRVGGAIADRSVPSFYMGNGNGLCGR